MKLSEFNLEKALAGANVVTRNGQQVVSIFCDKSDFDEYPVKFIVKLYTGDYMTGSATRDGIFNSKEQTANDLFMVAKVKTYWGNVYKSESGRHWVGELSTDEQVVKQCHVSSGNFIKTISFDVEE